MRQNARLDSPLTGSQASILIIALSWPRVLQSMVPYPSYWPLQGCVVSVVSLFKLSWCVLSTRRIAPDSSALLGSRFYCSKVSGRSPPARQPPDSLSPALVFTLNFIKCLTFGSLTHATLIYRLFRDASAYYAV